MDKTALPEEIDRHSTSNCQKSHNIVSSTPKLGTIGLVGISEYQYKYYIILDKRD